MTQSIREDILPLDGTLLPAWRAGPPLIRGKRSPGASRDKPTQSHRSIFLSDMHLGTRLSRADLILDFLGTHDAETVYLVGDIVDNWYPLSSNWKPAHHQVLQRLFDLPRTGTRVVYVPGNHDDFFRNYVGTSFGGIEIERDVVHQAADGRRYLVTHGDICDIFSLRAPLLARAGSFIERIAMGVDVAQRHVLRKFGQPEWFGIERAISRTNAAIRKHDHFEERLTHLAQSGGYDGIICGHFHQPALHDGFGISYANCGDWSGSNTAIVEDFDGRLDLVRVYEKTAFEPKIATDYEEEGELPLAV
jgi:UDP-2,3-diacylglucosamine pyrophosphatase LpxH